MKPSYIDRPANDPDSQEPIVPDGPVLKTAENACGAQPLELPSHEELAQLARDDPQAYEQLRRELVDNFIDSAPAKYRSRLSGIQFRVDCERQLSHSGLGSTVRVYKLMWQSFLGLNRRWQDLVRTKDEYENWHGSTALEYLPQENARILEFRPRLQQESQ